MGRHNYISVEDLQITNEDKDMADKMLDSNRLSYGPVTKEFEQEFVKIHI